LQGADPHSRRHPRVLVGVDAHGGQARRLAGVIPLPKFKVKLGRRLVDRETVVWISLALIAALATAPALGGVPLIPLLLMTIALAGAAHEGSRRLVIETARRHLNDHALRTTIIVIAAAPVVFLLPVELALLLADG